MVVQDQTEMFLNLNHHPVCAASDASHFFLLAQPPLLARRGDGPVRQVCYRRISGNAVSDTATPALTVTARPSVSYVDMNSLFSSAPAGKSSQA